MEPINMNYHKELDKTKVAVFMNKSNAAFLGSIMCSLNFSFDNNLKVPIQTDGLNVHINPSLFFDVLTQNQRVTKLIHVLWHVARLHPLRGINKNQEYWNKACDQVINLDMLDEKKRGINPKYEFYNVETDEEYAGIPEEALYQIYYKKEDQNQNKGDGDVVPCLDPNSKLKLLENVTKAVQSSGYSPTGSGDVKKLLDKFLRPKLDWKALLHQFFTDILDSGDSTWARPNRRYQDIYLPSHIPGEGRLEHLMYFLDVSGSICEHDINQFNSELKKIKEELKPQKLTVILFDTDVCYRKVFTEDMPFDSIESYIGGGTDYTCVHDVIVKEKPTAAVIFTDLWCEPMDPVNVPVLWVCNNNEEHKVKTGKIIRLIEEEDND